MRLLIARILSGRRISAMASSNAAASIFPRRCATHLRQVDPSGCDLDIRSFSTHVETGIVIHLLPNDRQAHQRLFSNHHSSYPSFLPSAAPAAAVVSRPSYEVLFQGTHRPRGEVQRLERLRPNPRERRNLRVQDSRWIRHRTYLASYAVEIRTGFFDSTQIDSTETFKLGH